MTDHREPADRVALQRVHTVLDNYDGPRSGVADYEGRPHFYRALFSEARDDWDADLFELSPLSPEAFVLAMEDWAIWTRFQAALQQGLISMPLDPEDWGALPEEQERHRQIMLRLESELVIDPTKRIIARGEFRAREPQSSGHPPGAIRPLDVHWERVE